MSRINPMSKGMNILFASSMPECRCRRVICQQQNKTNPSANTMRRLRSPVRKRPSSPTTSSTHLVARSPGRTHQRTHDFSVSSPRLADGKDQIDSLREKPRPSRSGRGARDQLSNKLSQTQEGKPCMIVLDCSVIQHSQERGLSRSCLVSRMGAASTCSISMRATSLSNASAIWR